MATQPAERGPLSVAFASPIPPLSAAYRNFISRRYFPLLDGLRCLSIVAVVAFHAGILSRGYEGVSLFFVISGFLITTILLREQSITGGISLKRFYLRRTFRIFPLYYAILALYVVLVIVVEKQSAVSYQFRGNIPYFLTYTSNWFVSLDSDRIVFFFAWSLATEEQFYLFWPWVIKAGAGAGSAVATMLGLLMLHYGVEFAAANGALAPSSLFTRVLMSVSPAICLGAIAAILVHRRTTFRLIQRCIGWRWSASAALAAMLLALAFDATPAWIVYLAMTWLVLSCALRPDHQPLGQVLTNPFVKHVGIVSYGIYLMHMLCINIARGLLHTHDGPLVFVLALAVSIAAATLSYRFFESPFLRWKDRLARRPEAC
jgi:peptidoglycan/LPS O-acetylase OafA/YrhL